MCWFTANDGAPWLAEIAERQKHLHLSEAADHRAVAWTWQSIRDSDQRGALASIKVPTLIVHGCDAAESPISHAHRLPQGIPGARLEVIEGAGHGLPVEHADGVADIFRPLFTQLDLSTERS